MICESLADSFVQRHSLEELGWGGGNAQLRVMCLFGPWSPVGTPLCQRPQSLQCFEVLDRSGRTGRLRTTSK